MNTVNGEAVLDTEARFHASPMVSRNDVGDLISGNLIGADSIVGQTRPVDGIVFRRLAISERREQNGRKERRNSDCRVMCVCA